MKEKDEAKRLAEPVASDHERHCKDGGCYAVKGHALAQALLDSLKREEALEQRNRLQQSIIEQCPECILRALLPNDCQPLRQAEQKLERLREFIEAEVQCACSLKERESGHLVGCWWPTLRSELDTQKKEK